MTADVVVVTWNSGDRVFSCLARLDAQDAPHRAWVVDNGSTDGTADAIARRFPEVELIRSDRNKGFGAAVNTAVRAASGDAVVLVNDDVELEPGGLAALLAPFSDPCVGMVAGLTVMPGRGVVDGFGIEVDVTLAAYNRLRHRLPDDRPGTLLGPSGGLAAYRRSAFSEVGGFDERLFAYGEDVDLALRLRLTGWTAASAADARGVHLGGATVGTDSPMQRRLAGFARAFLLRRYGVLRSRHAPRALLFELLVTVAGLVRGRTLVHIRGRVTGWRSAAGPTLPVPDGAVDDRIGLRETLRRLRLDR